VHCTNSVYCEKTQNLNQFSISDLYSFESESVLTQLHDRIRKKTGIDHGLSSMVKKMQQDGIQILHSHFGHVGITGSRMAKALNIPSVVTFYGMDLHQIPIKYPNLGALYPEMFENLSLILCEGNQMAQSVVSMGADESKVVVHPLGIELETIAYNPKFWKPGSTLKILIAASFRQKKGIPAAIEAISSLSDSYDFEVTVVGDAGLDQASLLEKDAIFKAVKVTGMESRVHFMGFRSHAELFELASEHHIYIQPSQHADDGDCEGGVPVTLIELAAHGIQVVSTYHCDIPSVVEHGKSGWLAPERNIAELTRVLNEAVQKYDSWGELSLNARKHIELNYNAKSQAKALYDLYIGVLNG
jgi:colanic acid/amylovoran biosynthesis glycosyltransferase